jgi:lipopolysaccharide transport protein LptA
MARSIRNPLLILACGFVTGSAAAAAAQQPSAPHSLSACTQPITLDAGSSSLDLATKTYVFTDIVITQCSLRLQADHARGTEPVNFSNSHWTFEGHVRIDADQRGSLRSDEAVVEFKDNYIARATITGKPAEFEQKRTDSDQVARGHADEIVYDVTGGTVRLTSNAWLSSGQQEISGPMLTYNMREQKVEAATAPGTGERVHIVIPAHGPAKADAARPDPAKPASGSSPQP